MSDDFIKSLILKGDGITGAVWQSDSIIEISRKLYPPFQAAILRQKLVREEHVQPLLGLPVAVIANFPKIGRWTGEAIALCEAHGKAWGQWSVLLRALGNEFPEITENPEISFNRRALYQHKRVKSVDFLLDRVLLVKHESGVTFRVALLYEYDLCGDDVRRVWDDLGPFEIILKTNPNGSILVDARDVAEALGIQIFDIKDLLSYLAKDKF